MPIALPQQDRAQPAQPAQALVQDSPPSEARRGFGRLKEDDEDSLRSLRALFGGRSYGSRRYGSRL